MPVHYHFSSPRLTCVFVHMRVEINWIPFKLQPSKNQGLFSSKQVYPSPLIKKQFELLRFHARFACHFPLQFRKTIGSQSEAGNQIGDLLHAEEFKKKKKNMHPIKNSLLLVKNVSCSSTGPRTPLPPFGVALLQ